MELRDQLRPRILPAAWEDLAPHFARDALLVLSADVDLLDVGVAIASDDAGAVVGWLQAGQLRKPTEADAIAWAAAPPAFQVLIVQPYVLAQAL